MQLIRDQATPCKGRLAGFVYAFFQMKRVPPELFTFGAFWTLPGVLAPSLLARDHRREGHKTQFGPSSLNTYELRIG